MTGHLQAHVERFIVRHIDSVEQLEVLLLLNSNPAERWSVDALYNIIKSNPVSIRSRLKSLVSQGLVRVDRGAEERFQIIISSPEMGQTLRDLVAEYETRRVKVIETIFSQPPLPIRSFAEAFNLRRRKDG